jgi:hypothetical protein
MELAYCLHDDTDEYVLKLLKSEIRYREICPSGIVKDVDRKITWLRKECERRCIDVLLHI